MSIRPVKPYFHEDDIEYILNESRNLLEGGGKLTQGKFTKAFEKEYSQYVGTKYAVATNSCTAGLDAIFRSLDIKGMEVIIPTNTFAATAYGVINAGGIPIFADIDRTMNIDPESVKSLVTNNTVGICVVHMGGYITPKIGELLDICDSNNLFLIEDAAHGHGASINGKNAGNIGLASSFSFYSTKVITTGEGGMITTNDEALFEKAAIIVNQGKMPKEKIPFGEGVYQNWQEFLGHNFRMNEFAAIMGLTQIRRLDMIVKDRIRVAKKYYQELANIEGIQLLQVDDSVVHNYYKIFCFTEPGVNRIKMYKDLKQEGVGMGGMTYEIPLHKIPAFKKYAKGDLHNSDRFCNYHICPPIFFGMQDSEILKVTSSIEAWLLKNK